MMAILAAILALSISSDKIDTFMHLPDWFPTSVDAEHTFGSDEHTNATHRTTLDTLASVESVFDAYHERVFYASEGRSNDWDRAVYGPRPTDLQQLWFTNQTNVASCFVYSTWTNDWPRATPDSRRLVEFDNAFELSRHLPALFRKTERAPWLDKGVTWGLDREIMFGSSWGPTNNTLPSIGWTETGAFRPDLAASCVPLCYCMTDSVFNVSSPSFDGFLYDLLKGLDSNFNALYRIEGGPWPEYSVRTNGWLAEWHNSCKWTNSVAAKTSVPGIITNNFPLAGPEVAMTNLTRRLIPDDYVIVDVTNVEHVVQEEHFNLYIDDIFERPRLYMTGPEPGDRDSDYVDAWMTWESTYNEYAQKIIRIHLNLDFVDPYTEATKSPAFLDPGKEHDDFYYPESEAPDGGCDKVTVRLEVVPHFFYGFQGPYYVDDETYYYEGWPATDEGGFEYSGTIEFVKIEVVTTAVHHASSLLATESRALAMLDRTYEIPKCVVPTNIPMTAAERDTKRTFYSSLIAEGSTDVSVSFGFASPGEYIPFQEPIRLSDILTTDGPKYSTSNVYSSIARPTVIERRMSVLSDTASGFTSLIPSAGPIPSSSYLVGDLKDFLSMYFGQFPGEYGRLFRIKSMTSYVFSGRFGKVTFFVQDFGPLDDDLFSFDLYNLVPTTAMILTVGASVSISRSASVLLGGVPSLRTFDRMYPWYGPGHSGYSNAAVGESRVMFAEEVMAFVSRSRMTSWNTEPIGLPSCREQTELDNPLFDWFSWHRLAVSNPTVDGSGLHASVYNESYDSLRNKVDSEFRAKVGSYDSASSLIPVSLELARLDDVSVTGLTYDFAGNDMTNDVTFVLNGPLPSDVRVMDGGGSVYSDSVPLVSWSLTLDPVQSGEVSFDTTYSKENVAVDGRLSPVIVTDWNWKALKSERNNK